MKEQILYYAIRYQGEWKRMQKAILNKEPYEIISYEGNYVTIEDENYPSCFKELEFAPWILFYEGDLSLCNMESCGIIGSRLASTTGLSNTENIVNILKKKYVIVSGLAKGIDAQAHRSSLDAHTIGVIGCGLDVIYPRENGSLYQMIRKDHLLLSEYPRKVKPLAFHFPWRNRLIAALSAHIIVIEARKRSGTLLTVNEALTLDKTIHCLPYNYGSEIGYGCNLLISQGADILVDEEDIYMI